VIEAPPPDAVRGRPFPSLRRSAGMELSRCRRIAVIGPTDVGKSRCVSDLLAGRPGAALIDLDPGQKMVGPPGTVSLGRSGRLERFRFIGTTSAADIRGIAEAAALLAEREVSFVANSSGFVRDGGIRLQIASVASLRADCVVAIGDGLEPILAGLGDLPVLRLDPSARARRKSPAARAALRQAAFAAALETAAPAEWSLRFEPSPPVPLAGTRRPVCALCDGMGEHMGLAILTGLADGRARLFTPPPPRPPATVLLGRMWAEPAGAGWRLQEVLSPAFEHEEAEG
jgi:polynucleotide 5'-hydroxyl-kinase GRC3/NOL9